MSKKKIINEPTYIENISTEPMDTIMDSRTAIYAKDVIQDRAIPDLRDGLKPVQRKIIYAMYRANNTFDHATRKCAGIVGDVMGKYHPHGDSSIYEALVRMSQDWKMSVPLIKFQGNNGSIDNDPPAAYRYTEAKLNEFSENLINEIDKNTIDMTLNFDDTLNDLDFDGKIVAPGLTDEFGNLDTTEINESETSINEENILDEDRYQYKKLIMMRALVIDKEDKEKYKDYISDIPAEMLIFVDDRLVYYINDDNADTGADGATVIPSGQVDVVRTVINGISHSLYAKVKRNVGMTLSRQQQELKEALMKSFGDNPALMEQINQAIESVNDEGIYKQIIDDLTDEVCETRSDNFLDVVESYGAEGLAQTAEDLVSIAELASRTSGDTESVQGPIDVAVITKVDGFVWKKRK